MKKKPTQAQGLVKLYREFSRQKYNTYKHKHPKLKESDIVAKVQKEWDAIGEKEKRALQKEYQQKNYEGIDDLEPASIPVKGTRRSVEKSISSKLSRDRSPASKFKIIETITDPVPDASESSEDRQFKKLAADSDSDNADRIPRAAKTGKKIVKKSKVSSETKNREYLSFYKYYYDKLSNEHSKWKANQISTIIKLLWKKRIISKRREHETRRKQIKAGKGMKRILKPKRTSAYLTFKRKFLIKYGPGTTIKHIKSTFKRLTFEHKMILNRQAQIQNNDFVPIKARAHDDAKFKVAQLESSSEIQPFGKPLGFLNRVMH